MTDQIGNIIEGNDKFPLVHIALTHFDILPIQKKLLVNTLDRNYSICKIPFRINNSYYFQYILEEWRMKIIPHHKRKESQINYDSFTVFEKEIIYALLNGYSTNKEIDLYLKSVMKSNTTGNVKHTITALFSKLGTDNRVDLLKLLFSYELDKYLPRSLFPQGLYDI